MDTRDPARLFQAWFVCIGGYFTLFMAGAYFLLPHDDPTKYLLIGGFLVGIPVLVTVRHFPVGAGCMLLFALLSMLAGTLVGYHEAAGDYELALQWMQEGEYEDAQGLFDTLSGFRDSEEKVAECKNYIEFEYAIKDVDSYPTLTYSRLRKLKGFEPADKVLASPAMQEARVKALEVGGSVPLGRYYWNTSLSTSPMSWRIIARDGDLALLDFSGLLEFQPLHDADQPVTWADCSLRQWMNGELLQALFTPEEQALIVPTKVSIGDESATVVEDRLFLLSYAEVSQYLPDVSARVRRISDYVKYQYHIDIIDDYDAFYNWLLRPVGDAGTAVPYIDRNGDLQTEDVVTAPCGIRPALWVRLDPDFF